MWIVCITSVRHVLTVNGYGGRQTKENEKSWCFKGWETLVNKEKILRESNGFLLSKISYLSLRDGFMRCKDTKNAMKSIIICQIKCVRTNSIFMFLLGKCKRFVEQYQLFQITNN